MQIVVRDHLSPFLTSATRAEELALEILRTWNVEHIVLDFADVVQMSPSFANTFLLNLLHYASEEELKCRVSFQNVPPFVQRELDRAVDRKARGAKLTAYVAD